MRRIVALAEGNFSIGGAKTAVGMIRYGRDEVVAVLDSTQAGRDVAEVIGVGAGIPIVGTLAEALPRRPDTLLIGISPRGGALPPEWRAIILEAIESGLDIVNGLHYFFGDDPDLARAATQAGREIWDVRRPKDDLDISHFLPHRPGSVTVAAVGSDCSTGKMTVMLELERLARQRGLNATFVATGQTGIMIWGDGVPLDRVIGDFMAGAMEELVVAACEQYDWVFVEGQGSIYHPAYSGVTLALVHGALPDLLVLCHQPSRTQIRGYEIDILPLDQIVRDYEIATGWVKPAKVVGVALNTYDLSDQQARDAIAEAGRVTGLPVTDPVRFGAEPLLEALLAGAESRVNGPASKVGRR
ncbi:MAG TPA: DUF1611 domain-containing protein [Dehalococcoidia bacterium]|nr:DUF1611 domain-containing protein [Dehalococcoidia bacterium]